MKKTIQFTDLELHAVATALALVAAAYHHDNGDQVRRGDARRTLQDIDGATMRALQTVRRKIEAARKL